MKLAQYVSNHKYARLTRFDKPIGTYLLLLPCLFSIFFNYNGTVPFILIIKFTIGAFIMRSAGCVINDIIDRKIDAKVERTKNRPLASGEVSLTEAILLLFSLLVLGLLILLSLNKLSIILGFIIIIPVLTYPLMKRITYWPQLFLGVVFNWGVIIASAATINKVPFESIFLYIACVFWTLGYDTIYAHQDKKDDISIGVKSTALKLGAKTKLALSFFYSITILMLFCVGIIAKMHLIYFLLIALPALHLLWQIKTLNINNPEDCKSKFISNQYFGLLLLIAIIVAKIL